MTLVPPAGFVFPGAVLQIEHRISLATGPCRNQEAYKRSSDRLALILGKVEGLPQLAMRHVLEGVEVLVMGGDLDPAAPAAAAVEVKAAGVRNLGAVNPELVVVEAFVPGTGVADPDAVIALGQGDPLHPRTPA